MARVKGALALFLLGILLSSCAPKYVERTQTFRSLVAAHDLKAGEHLKENDLRVVEVKKTKKERLEPSMAPILDVDVPSIPKLVGMKLINDIPAGSKFQVGHDCEIGKNEKFELRYDNYSWTGSDEAIKEEYSLASNDLPNSDRTKLGELLDRTEFLRTPKVVNRLDLKPNADFVSILLRRADFGAMGNLPNSNSFVVGDSIEREFLSTKTSTIEKELIDFIKEHGTKVESPITLGR